MKNSIHFFSSLFAIFGLSLSLNAEVISSIDFESVEAGESLSRKIFQSEGFTTGTWDNGLAARTIVDTAESCSGSKSMRIMYPKGGYGTSETGCQVQLRFNKIDEAFASYNLRFSDNFTWGTTSYGGKLPGLGGGNNCSGGSNCDGTNGFSARLMWRTGGKAVLYLYHMDKPSKYGEDVDLLYPDGSPVVFIKGEWYHIAERVKINSGADKYDGEVEIWVNGLPVLLRKGLRFVTNDDKVDNLYISTFHGGSDKTWAPTDTCFSWLDDIRIGTEYEDVSMPNFSNSKELYSHKRTGTDKIKVYNQSPNELKIDGLYGNSVVYIYSLDGKLVKSSKTSQLNTVIDIHDLNSGNYILQVKDELGNYSFQYVKAKWFR